MPIGTFLNGGTITQLRGLAWLALSDVGQRGTVTVTSDTGGGGSQVWNYAGTVPCRVDPLADFEGIIASKLSDRSTHLVTVPPGIAITPRDRFAITGRGTFEVTSVHTTTGEALRFFEVVQVS